MSPSFKQTHASAAESKPSQHYHHSGICTSYDDSEVDEFYTEFRSLVDQTSKQDILVVQGDWNAKVEEDAQEDWGEVCGTFCNTETNDRGHKLLDFATYNNLVLANTLGNHKPSRRWTWHSQDGTQHN